MGYKKYIGLLIIFIDLFLVLAIIGFIGIKPFAIFCLYYLAGLFGWSIIFRLTGILDEKRWEKAYNRNYGKINWINLSGVIGFIITGLLFVSILDNYIWVSSVITSGIIVLYLNYITGDFLHNLMEIQEFIQDMMVKKYKWLRK